MENPPKNSCYFVNSSDQSNTPYLLVIDDSFALKTSPFSFGSSVVTEKQTQLQRSPKIVCHLLEGTTNPPEVKCIIRQTDNNGQIRVLVPELNCLYQFNHSQQFQIPFYCNNSDDCIIDVEFQNSNGNIYKTTSVLYNRNITCNIVSPILSIMEQPQYPLSELYFEIVSISPLSAHYKKGVEVSMVLKGVKVDMTDVFIGNTSVDLGYFPKIKAWKFTSPQGSPNVREPIILKDIDGNYYHTNHYFYFEPDTPSECSEKKTITSFISSEDNSTSIHSSSSSSTSDTEDENLPKLIISNFPVKNSKEETYPLFIQYWKQYVSKTVPVHVNIILGTHKKPVGIILVTVKSESAQRKAMKKLNEEVIEGNTIKMCFLECSTLLVSHLLTDVSEETIKSYFGKCKISVAERKLERRSLCLQFKSPERARRAFEDNYKTFDLRYYVELILKELGVLSGDNLNGFSFATLCLDRRSSELMKEEISSYIEDRKSSKRQILAAKNRTHIVAAPPQWESSEGWCKMEEVTITKYSIPSLFSSVLNKDSEEVMKVQIKREPFAKGTFRAAYYLRTPDGGHYVAKKLMLNTNQAKKLLADIKCHLAATYLAEVYNSKMPPKTIVFPPIAMIHCQSDHSEFSGCYMTIEPYLGENYFKFNNNGGMKARGEKKSQSAQAFSHFTYYYTQNRIMVADIQGVKADKRNYHKNSYCFTDPAILVDDDTLTAFESDSNTGRKGIEKFFETHECNHICKQFNLVKHPQQKLADDPEQTPVALSLSLSNV